MSNQTPVIELKNVKKSFGPVEVLKDVNFTVRAGEVTALVGDNGAGKSTLIKGLAGIQSYDSGTVLFEDKPVELTSPRQSSELGIDVVYQDLALCDNLDIVHNMFLGREEVNAGVLDEGHMESKAVSTLTSLSVKTVKSVRQKVAKLSGGQRQTVAIARAVLWNNKVVILDEPTAGVDVELRQTLWQFIAKLNREGHTVLLTTHYLEEAEALCGRLAMLKQGRVLALASTSELLKSASSNVLRFKIDGQLPIDLAAKARITGRIVQFPAHDAVEIESYLAAVRQAGLIAEDVEIRKADLEDVFLDVMSEGKS